MTLESPSESTLGWLGYVGQAARTIAISTVDGAHTAAVQGLLDEAVDIEEDGLLVEDVRHAGEPARRVDALAESGARRGHRQGIDTERDVLGARIKHFVYTSEESGTRTQILPDRTLITRVDPLDGTTNSLNVLAGFCSEATVDFHASRHTRAVHLAGAIVGGTIDVSWVNTQPRNRVTQRYARPSGAVYVRVPRLSPQWARIPGLREDRQTATVAAVASSKRRAEAVTRWVEAAFAHDGRAYNLGGNPILPALLIGQIGCVVEPEHTKLHDAAFLIPFVLLGGTVTTWEGTPLDVLETYEQYAGDLDASRAPIPPYVAYVESALTPVDQAAS